MYLSRAIPPSAGSDEPSFIGHGTGLTPGGFEEISYTTRLTPATSFVILDEIFRRTAGGNANLGPRLSTLEARFSLPDVPIGSHEVLTLYRTQCDHLFVCSLVTHHSNCSNGEQDCKGLSDLVVQSSSAYLLDIYVIGFLKNLDLRASDWTEDSNRKTRTREGVPTNEMGRNLKESPKSADFVYTLSQSVGVESRADESNKPLNSSLKGSMSFNFMSFSKPPTL
jgi:hypothetical protein